VNIPPTDVPFNLEPVLAPSSSGGTVTDGVRFVINLQLGNAPPIRAYLDTGSSGILVAPDAPQATLDAIATTQQPFSEAFGSGITTRGVLGSASITIGNRTTASPIGVALVQQLSGGSGGSTPLQQFFNGYAALVGIGMRNFSSSLGNPIVQLPGEPSYVVAAPTFGGTAGNLRIGPTASDVSSYKTLQLSASSGATLPNGMAGWADDAVPLCVEDATSGMQFCAGAILDTGNPGSFIDWPGYSGPALLAPGSQIDVTAGPQSAPIGGFSMTVSSAPQPGLDAINVGPSSPSSISLGTLLFYRLDVLFDQQQGRIGMLPHGSGQAPP
jgi:hypothetical protein